MRLQIHDNKNEMGEVVAAKGATLICEAIDHCGYANIILATGSSQFEMLEQLTSIAKIDWSKVTIFHLDEYCEIDENHPASFRKYLRERVADKLPTLKRFVWIDGDAADWRAEIERLNADIKNHPIDVAFIGIGENGHLAFNDPPADFEATSAFLFVTPDEKSRQQQVKEGWFKSIDVVPTNAISMSLQQILKSRHLFVTVPDARKAVAVKAALEGPICRQCPASILRVHRSVQLHLDTPAASNLEYFENKTSDISIN